MIRLFALLLLQIRHKARKRSREQTRKNNSSTDMEDYVFHYNVDKTGIFQCFQISNYQFTPTEISSYASSGST